MESLKLRWWPESCDSSEENPSGSRIRQLTSSFFITHDYYCEQPYCSADGNRLALFRLRDTDPDVPGELMVYDISTYKLARLERDVFGVANSAWSGVLFVTAGEGEHKRLLRYDLNTLEREEIFSWSRQRSAQPIFGLASVSADGKWGVASGVVEGETKRGREFGIYRVNLESGDTQLLYSNPHICNPHLQIRLYNASRILVQENRGCVMDDDGNLIKPFDERGVGLFSLAADGSDRRDFPVGPPLTANTTGHECWIGDTDRVLVTLAKTHQDGGQTGNLMEVCHDWEKPRIVFDSPHVWNHISASCCGKYFVTDSYEVPGVPLLIGSIASGKTRVLCDSKTAGGGAQYTHAHPYMTSDNKWVVFNSDRTGIAQTYIASIPDGFLEELDS